MRAFGSYAHSDRPEVERYIARLEAEPKIEFFWDAKIQPGDSWLDVLAKEVTEASTLVVWVSADACRSRMVRNEVLSADNKDAHIIPVLLDELEPEQASSGLMLALHGRQGIEAHKLGFDAACEKLRIALGGAPALPPPPPTPAPPKAAVVSVMGTQGGVGKSTTIQAMSELIASTGANVLVIDTDIVTGGITHRLSPRARTRPRVLSVLDAAYRYGKEGIQPAADAVAWDVTPDYLADDRFGRIFLVPARLDGDDRPGFEALADIPTDARNPAAVELLERFFDAARRLPKPIDCVLIDSGAAGDPLVSAGFVLARYGFVVARPNVVFRKNIAEAESQHRLRYPHHTFNAMRVIVNQATPETAENWGNAPDVTFAADDPQLRRAETKGTYDFEGVGLYPFFLSVLRALRSSFSPTEARLLPQEEKIWIAPYVRAMEDFPETVLARPAYRFLGLITSVGLVVVALTIAFCATVYYRTGRESMNVITTHPVVKPSGESEKAFKDRLEAVQIPADLADKVALLEPGQLRIQGALTPADVERLKKASEYDPFKDAVVQAGPISTSRVTELAVQQSQARQALLIAGIVAIACGVWLVLRHRKYSQRVAMLKDLIRARAAKSGTTLIDFLKKLIAGDSGRPLLRWLRDEFRAHAPLLKWG